jgi:cytoskeletal protein CcmA (bactofilin family)
MGWFTSDPKDPPAVPLSPGVPASSSPPDPAVPVKSSLRALDPRSVEPKTMQVRSSEALPRPSVLGRSVQFRGELRADENLTIDGTVRGSILQSQRLQVGREGSVIGDITARTIIIEGHVKGDLRASESIHLNASAQVEGDLYTPSLHLTEGARYQGSIDMQPKPPILPTPAARLPQPPPSPPPALTAPVAVALLEAPGPTKPAGEARDAKTPISGLGARCGIDDNF